MKYNPTVQRWTEIRGMPVVALNTRLTIGIVEDFYFEPESNALRGLRVKTGLSGYKALPSNAISAIGSDAITTDNAEMVIEESHDGRIAELPSGHSLFSYKIVSENGDVVGTVGNILLNTNPPIALRIAAFELAGRGYQVFSANEVTHYGRDVIVILDQVARQLT